MQHGPKIAAHTTSGALQIRRAAWVSSRGDAPGYNGRTIIDPKYIPDDAARVDYQGRLSAWFRTLDHKAQHFLGPDWAAMCDPMPGKKRNRTTTTTTPAR